MALKGRPPLGQRFTVLVVPGNAYTSIGVSIPKVITAKHRHIPVAAEAGPKHVQASFWAFGGDSRKAVIAQLRELADWLEKPGR